MNSNEILHIPVLAKEVITYLRLKRGMVIADCTIGAGGHAAEILEEIGDSGCLIGIDRDKDALKEARARLTNISTSFKLFHANYKDVEAVLKEANISKVDGVLFDLGPSSLQMDRAERGFSIRMNGPLDMRMDQGSSAKASEIVNSCAKSELAAIFREYGEEHFAYRIAERIARERKKERIKNTARLAHIVTEALPYRYRFRRIHPATKVFMALRIAVNNEIENLQAVLGKIALFLNDGSRLCVISFHSIEDRIVKNKFKELIREVKSIKNNYQKTDSAGPGREKGKPAVEKRQVTGCRKDK
jgi:16S rRNA (cytosine1402-N4)-methyltransferase